MVIAYIIYFIELAIFVSIIIRTIADSIKYRRNMQKGNAQPLANPAQITVARRESSGLTAFAAWDFYLNGENIGSIKNGASLTVTSNWRINVLVAKDSHGAESPPLKFYSESGGDSQAVFNGGRFQNTQGMSVILPFDEPEGFAKIMGGNDSKRRIWIYWALLICYYAAVFFLSRGDIVLAFVLPFLPLIILSFIGRSAYRAVVDYLSVNRPGAWGGMETPRRFYLSRLARISFYLVQLLGLLIFLNKSIDDLEYLELKIQYERVLCAQHFSGCACIGTILYTLVTIA